MISPISTHRNENRTAYFRRPSNLRATGRFSGAPFCVKLTQVVEEIRADSVLNETDRITMAEIDAEVAAVRTARRRRK